MNSTSLIYKLVKRKLCGIFEILEAMDEEIKVWSYKPNKTQSLKIPHI